MAVVVLAALLSAPPAQASAPASIDPAVLAQQIGKPVEVTSATTPTDLLVANPNGTMTLTRSAIAVRKRVNGVWTKLDAMLRANADGTISPALTSAELSFSGGGNGPVATMRNTGKKLALSLPFPLPKPELAGATATYRGVLPGVDLQMTASTRGGFTQVFVVHNAIAAANPALRSLVMATQADGLTIASDAEGNLRAADSVGKAVFTAPAPVMWDSAGKAVERLAPIGVQTRRSAVELTPDAGMLNGPGTVYPVYIDPAWEPVLPPGGGARSGYASVAAAFPTSSKWNNTADPNPDNLQLGWNNQPWHARTMVNFGLDLSQLNGANIIEAHINARSVYSGSCTARKTRVFAPATALGPGNATWNNWHNDIPLGAEVGSATFSGGYNSGCAAQNVVFPVLAGVTGAVAAGRSTQTFVFTGDTNETSDTASYKELSLASLSLEITYNHAPSQPTNLTTSPQTPCTGTVGTVGDGDVLLYAPVSDPDGRTVGVRYEVWKSSAPGAIIFSTDPVTTPYSSGATAVITLPESLLKTQAPTAITEFSWRVQISDGFTAGFATSPWSATCKFNFDPTRPGAPRATAPAAGSTQIGQTVAIAVTKPVTGTIPASYLYQLNAGAPGTVTADAAGNATISIKPTRRTNTLTITALSAGGNAGVDSANLTFTTAPLAVESKDADLDRDGFADLVTVGGAAGLPPGVWQAAGRTGSKVDVVGANIGINGNGVAGDNKPTNFNGGQVFSAIYAGTGLQDVLVYYPSTGAGSVMLGNGDGSPLQPQLSGNQFTLFAEDLKEDGVSPLQLVNGGNAVNNPDDHTADFLAVGGASGSRHLSYYFNASPQNLQGIIPLSASTPAGDMNWDQWRIATAQVAPTGTVKTSLLLWKPSTGALHLWRDLNLDLEMGTFTYQPFQLAASGWNSGATLNLQAADVNNDGIADVRTIASGTVTTYLVTNLTGTTGTVTAQPAQALITADHAWILNDGTSGAVGASAAKDIVGTAHMSGTAGATWNTGDVFNPSVKLDGASGILSADPPINTNADFTISVWVKPTTASGTVLSLNGANTATMRLYADGSDKSWRFGLSLSDVAAPVWNTAAAPANSVQTGVWTQLTATYKKSTGVIRLYVNSVEKAAAVHVTGWNSTTAGAFKAGAHKTSPSAYGAYYTGQLSSIQAWTGAVLAPGTGPALPVGIDTIGTYVPNGGTFYLRNSNTSGIADYIFGHGGGGHLPVSGDWNGDGVTTIGTWDTSTNTFYLRNSNTSGIADYIFGYGCSGCGDIPVAGDWNGDGITTIGIYRPNAGTFYLRNSNDSGNADYIFGHGGGGHIPVSGDWNGDGVTTIGTWDTSTNTFYLRNSNTSGIADYIFGYGCSGCSDTPVAGDWNGDGITTIGIYRPNAGTFYLRNSNDSGNADYIFGHGGGGHLPITGDWNG